MSGLPIDENMIEEVGIEQASLYSAGFLQCDASVCNPTGDRTNPNRHKYKICLMVSTMNELQKYSSEWF